MLLKYNEATEVKLMELSYLKHVLLWLPYIKEYNRSVRPMKRRGVIRGMERRDI